MTGSLTYLHWQKMTSHQARFGGRMTFGMCKIGVGILRDLDREPSTPKSCYRFQDEKDFGGFDFVENF